MNASIESTPLLRRWASTLPQLPFQGDPGANQLVYAGSVTSRIQINKDSQIIRLVNQGLYVCYVRVGNSTVEATTADLPVLAGESIVGPEANNSGSPYIVQPVAIIINVVAIQ